MRLFWQYKENREKLLVFCNGWGMDHQPLLPLAAHDYDVLLLSDFQKTGELEELFALIAGYPCRVLVGWSMGVWNGQNLFAGQSRLFSRAIAINGTLCPVDDRWGIPVDLFTATLDNWTEATRLKFYRRLAGGSDVYRQVAVHCPERSVEDQRQELVFYLRECDCRGRADAIYTTAVVASHDRFVPTANQLAFWGDGAGRVDGGHFPFYRWPSWDAMLAEV